MTHCSRLIRRRSRTHASTGAYTRRNSHMPATRRDRAACHPLSISFDPPALSTVCLAFSSSHTILLLFGSSYPFLVSREICLSLILFLRAQPSLVTVVRPDVHVTVTYLEEFLDKATKYITNCLLEACAIVLVYIVPINYFIHKL